MTAPELRAMASAIREVAVLAEVDGWFMEDQTLDAGAQVRIRSALDWALGRIPPVGAAELLETAARILDESPEEAP